MRLGQLWFARVAIVLGVFFLAAPGQAKQASPELARATSILNGLPLAFEENVGQFDAEAAFRAGGNGRTIFFTRESVFFLVNGPDGQGRALRLTPMDMAEGVRLEGRQARQARLNYIKDKEPARWRGGVRLHDAVAYAGAYPGIDIVFYFRGDTLEYDLVCAAGADPTSVRFSLEGAEACALNEAGGLEFTARGRVWLTQKRPVGLQEMADGQHRIDGSFEIVQNGHRQVYRLVMDEYDRSAPLVVDPALGFSSYFGKSFGDYAINGLTLDGSGSLYIAGTMRGDQTNLPVTPGAYRQSSVLRDAFVAKFSADGSQLLYATFFGGGEDDFGNGIAVDALGQAIITGSTRVDNPSELLPVTAGVFQATPGGFHDAFLAKLSADGSALIFSTFLGGAGNDGGSSVALSSSGNECWITGYTNSDDFPLAGSGHGGIDVFIARCNATATTLQYTTCLGGGADEYPHGLSLDSSDNVYIAGRTLSDDFPQQNNQLIKTVLTGEVDAFVVKLLNDGGLAFSTYLGGSGDDFGNDLALLADDDIVVTGYTNSLDFVGSGEQPAGDSDAFLTRILIQQTAPGNHVDFTALYGGTLYDTGKRLAVGPNNSVYLQGITWSSDFPTSPDALDGTLGGDSDAFLMRVNPADEADPGAIEFSTYFGGSNQELDDGMGLAVGPDGNAYFAFTTFSGDVPAKGTQHGTFGSGQPNGIVAMIEFLGGGGYGPAVNQLLLDD